MPIPDRDRVIYRQNPLQEVICQLRFPRLLVIEEQVPARFQALIEQDYPILEARNVVQFSVEASQGGGKVDYAKAYEFASSDGKWKAVLTSEFVALTTTEYPHWGAFRDRLHALIDAFLQCYKPAHLLRVGLRYRDLISRSRLHLDAVPWSELIEPHIAGVLSHGNLVEGEITACRGSFVYQANPNVRAQVQHGLTDPGAGESEYMIDCDFFNDGQHGATTDAALAVLDSFRPHPYNLFRWCITERLHDAMGPTPAAKLG